MEEGNRVHHLSMVSISRTRYVYRTLSSFNFLFGYFIRGERLFNNPVSRVGAHSRGALNGDITVDIFDEYMQSPNFDVTISIIPLIYSVLSFSSNFSLNILIFCD